MARIGDICELPTGLAAANERMRRLESAKAEREMRAKQGRKEAYKARRHGESMYMKLRMVRAELGIEPERRETAEEIVCTCRGQRSPKRARNGFSKEQAGTVGNVVVTRRFPNSRLTCVCRTRMV